MTATVHYLRPFRLVGRPCGNGTSFEAPCRDIADLPPDLRERVLAARGVPVDRNPEPPPEAA